MGTSVGSEARLDRAGLEPLLHALEEAALDPAQLRGRTSVVLVEPGGGRRAALSAFLEEASSLEAAGVHPIGLVGGRVDLPVGYLGLPFPIRPLPEAALERLAGEGRTPVVFLLFPDQRGIRIPCGSDPGAVVERVEHLVAARRMDAIRSVVLRSVREEVVLSPTSPPDLSTGVGRLDVRAGFVVIAGDPGTIGAQAAIMAEANRRVRAAGHGPVFARLVHVATTEDPGWYVAAVPATSLAEAARTEPAGGHLAAVLDALDHLHLATRSRPRTSAERSLRTLLEVPWSAAFGAGVRRAFGDGVDPDRLLSTPLRFPDGATAPSYRALVGPLSARPRDLAPSFHAWIHGAPSLANAFVGPEGVRFVAPRVDGPPGGDARPVVGDPAEDAASLLTSWAPLAAVERAVAAGDADSLVVLEERPGELVLRSGRPGRDATALVPGLGSPPGPSDPAAPVRIHVAAAARLIAALATARSFRRPSAWLCVFGAALRHLVRAGELLEPAV